MREHPTILLPWLRSLVDMKEIKGINSPKCSGAGGLSDLPIAEGFPYQIVIGSCAFVKSLEVFLIVE